MVREIVVHVGKEKNKLVALVENGKLVEKYEELEHQRRLEGNIYIGKVENVLYGMQAAFVDIGEGKNTFIHIRDIIPKISDETGNKNEVLSKHDIKNYVRTGMPILVQVKRDSTNKKGARVSTHISFSGRFIVIMPNANFITISQKIEDEKEKERLKQIVRNCLPKGYGAIVRTAACEKSEEIIEKDVRKVIQKLRKVESEFANIQKNNAKDFKPQLLYHGDGLIHKILTDVIDQEVDKIWVDDEIQYHKILEVVKDTENSQRVKVELKQNNLLTMYDLDDQLESMENRKVWLKCGGTE